MSRPPMFEIRLYMVAPRTWEFLVKRAGEPVAASDGDARLDGVEPAIKAALEALKADVLARRAATGNPAE
jgi:hypothetical protein